MQPLQQRWQDGIEIFVEQQVHIGVHDEQVFVRGHDPAECTAGVAEREQRVFFGIINVIAILFPKDGPGSVVEALEGFGNILMSLVGTISDGVGAFQGDP